MAALDDETRFLGGTKRSGGFVSESASQFAVATGWTTVYFEIAYKAETNSASSHSPKQLVNTCRSYSTGSAAAAGWLDDTDK